MHWLANIGDSISQAFDANDEGYIDIELAKTNPDAVFHDDPKYSWVQGTDPAVASVRAYYKKSDPGLVMEPLSVSGAELVGKGSDKPNFEAQARTITKKPDLVYVLLGGNDVCNRQRATDDEEATAHMYTVAEWREAAVKGLTALEDVLEPGATVRVISMPRVDLLASVGSMRISIRQRPLFGGEPAVGQSTCSSFWALAALGGRAICPIVTLEPSADKLKAVGKRIDEYNSALAEEVRRFATKSPKKIAFQSDWHGSIDDNPANKDKSGGTFVFGPDHVSKRDCFHPSIAGQNAIADFVLNKANFEP